MGNLVEITSIPQGVPVTMVMSSLGLLAVLFVSLRMLYNVFLHPLRKYPGPWYMAAARLPYALHVLRGDPTHRVTTLHEKYGHIVRIAPDTLSYTCGQAWEDIYGIKKSDKRGNLPKDPKHYIKTLEGVDTISTANDADHRRLRRIQAHAFSDRALSLQQDVLLRYTTLFVSRLREQCTGAGAGAEGNTVDLMKWLNFLTTDIIGDLSFGQSFGGLETGEFHPWLRTVFSSLKAFTFVREASRLPSFVMALALRCIPKHLMEHMKQALQFGAEAAGKRIKLGAGDRADFMSYILKHNDERGMSRDEIEAAAITFIVAGSETTATMLSGTIYLLLHNRDVLSELTRSIRTQFPTTEGLTSIKLGQHEYLNAVLKEGLRLYPPAADMLFRSTLDESAIVVGEVVPPHTSLTINLWAANRSPANFHRPTEFLPGRWLTDAAAAGEFGQDDKRVFKPFSLGPRDCIGKNLAWAEMRLILAHMLWNFDFVSVDPDSEGWIEKQKIFTLWQKPDLNVRITPRKGRA